MVWFGWTLEKKWNEIKALEKKLGQNLGAGQSRKGVLVELIAYEKFTGSGGDQAASEYSCLYLTQKASNRSLVLLVCWWWFEFVFCEKLER